MLVIRVNLASIYQLEGFESSRVALSIMIENRRWRWESLPSPVRIKYSTTVESRFDAIAMNEIAVETLINQIIDRINERAPSMFCACSAQGLETNELVAVCIVEKSKHANQERRSPQESQSRKSICMGAKSSQFGWLPAAVQK